MDSIDDINPKTLSIRLREMEKDRLIERKVYHEVPVRIEYTLTEKAMALTPVLEQMALFSMKYCSQKRSSAEESLGGFERYLVSPSAARE